MELPVNMKGEGMNSVLEKTDLNENGTTTDSLSDLAYQYLVNKIINGSIRYGTKLNIKQLAGELNISTMPIRDALKQLAIEQIVTIKPRSSCIVRTPSKKEVLESLEARKMIELHVARSIYPSVLSEELFILKEIIEDMSRVLPSGDETVEMVHEKKLAYIDLDRKFHTAFCDLAKNSFVTKFYRELNISLSMSFRYEVGSEHSPFHTFDIHKSIVTYLEMHSADVIGLLESHLSMSYHNIINGELFKKLSD